MISAFEWLNLFVIILLALLYLGGRISPAEQNFVWALSFLIPFALIVNILLLIINLIYVKPASIAYALLLLVGNNYLLGSVGFKFLFKRKEKGTNSFTLLNYNVSSLYSLYTETVDNVPPNPRAIQIKNWIMQNNADIQCYQEFLNLPGHSEFDLTKRLQEKGYHIYFSKSEPGFNDHQVGMVIASRFPIVAKGDLVTVKAKHQFHFNRIMYADLKIEEDTVRVINFHLASMALKNHNPLTKRSFDDVISNSKIILDKLKNGAVDRSRQVDGLVEFIRKSPYRIICVGDFNDLPYTYAYQQMKKVMSNTFEDQGKGFGFTYNGNILRTLRIDNQFYSKGISPLDFETLNQINCSDHFPIRGRYSVVGL